MLLVMRIFFPSCLYLLEKVYSCLVLSVCCRLCKDMSLRSELGVLLNKCEASLGRDSRIVVL